MEFVEIDSTQALAPVTNGQFQWLHFNNTLSIVAITMGLCIFVIAYFAGGRENSTRIIFSVVLAWLVGFFSMPLLIRAATWLGLLDMPYGNVILVSVLILLVAALAANAYEIVTVTAREARPPD